MVLRRKFLQVVILVIVISLALFPTMAKADSVTDEDLDILEYRVSNQFCMCYELPTINSNILNIIELNDVIPVVGYIDHIDNFTDNDFAIVRTKNSIGYILEQYLDDFRSVENPINNHYIDNNLNKTSLNDENISDVGTYVGQIKVTFYGCEAFANGGGTNTCWTIPLKSVVGQICASYQFPQGTVLYIEGVGTRIVADTGVNHIDVLVNSESETNALGNHPRNIWIMN